MLTTQPVSRKQILAKTRGNCAYCGMPLTICKSKPWHMDHIHPKSRGGAHHPKNFNAACRNCNTKKRDRTPEEFKAALMIEAARLIERSVDVLCMVNGYGQGSAPTRDLIVPLCEVLEALETAKLSFYYEHIESEIEQIGLA